jgi:hypothetical protein
METSSTEADEAIYFGIENEPELLKSHTKSQKKTNKTPYAAWVIQSRC